MTLPRLLFGALLPLFAWPVLAQELSLDDSLNSDLLPAGRQALRADVRSGQASQQFDDRGDQKALFADFDGLPLNLIFPAPAGVNLGTTQLHAKLSGERLRLTYGYGINDDLTAGVAFGWVRLRNQVDFTVAGANIPNATQILQATLGSAPYGYKPIASTSSDSPLDPNFGLRWRMAKGEGWSTVLAPVLRIGLAKQDDPDNLMDVQFEDGSTDLQLAIEHYRQWGAGWEGRGAVQLTHALSDHVTARPYASGSLPLVAQASTEELGRQMGDAYAVTLDLARRLGDWRWSGSLEYAYNAETDYTSPSGQDVSGLAANTDGWTLKGWLGVSWSGIRGYLAEGKGLPVIVSLQYETLLGGRNAVKSDNLHLVVTLPF